METGEYTDQVVRMNTWLSTHPGDEITKVRKWPGYWTATREGQVMARYDDLELLLNRLEANWDDTREQP